MWLRKAYIYELDKKRWAAAVRLEEEGDVPGILGVELKPIPKKNQIMMTQERFIVHIITALGLMDDQSTHMGPQCSMHEETTDQGW